MTDYPNEPLITINGHALSVGESMTVRNAVTGFHMQMRTEGLGDDEHGKRMAEAHVKNCESIFRKMGILK
jgi:hypothetical protein